MDGASGRLIASAARGHVTRLLAGRAPFVSCYFALTIACAIALPRGGPIWLTLLALPGAVEFWLARRLPNLRVAALSPIMWVAIFAAAAMVSALWAPSAADAIVSGSIVVIGVLALLASGAGLFVDHQRLAEAARGLCAGICAGLALAAFETVSDLYITRMVMTAFPGLQVRYIGKHIDVVHGAVTYLTDNFMNRFTLAATMFLVPCLALARRFCSRRAQQAVLLVAVVYVVCVLGMSRHQSSQLALVTGFAAACLAWRSIASVRRVVVAGWCAAVLLSPALATAIDAAKLQDMKWPVAIQARLAIWADTAREIPLRPLWGIGAGGAQALVDESRQPTIHAPDHAPPARHAHNAYLQVWYELGLLGVIPFLMVGLCLISRISALPPSLQPFAYVQAVMAIFMLATSFGLWQSWVQSVYAMSGVVLVIAAREARVPLHAAELYKRGQIGRHAPSRRT